MSGKSRGWTFTYFPKKDETEWKLTEEEIWKGREEEGQITAMVERAEEHTDDDDQEPWEKLN